MGAVIPRYKREALWRFGVGQSRSTADANADSVRISSLPLVLDDLAEAVEHASVVLTTGGGGICLKLTACAEKVLVDACEFPTR